MHCLSVALLHFCPSGTVLFTSHLEPRSALHPWGCTLHCHSSAVPSGHCVQHDSSGLCFALPLWGCVRHFPPPGAMLCTAPLGLCSHCLFEAVLLFKLWFVLPLWGVSQKASGLIILWPKWPLDPSASGSHSLWSNRPLAQMASGPVVPLAQSASGPHGLWPNRPLAQVSSGPISRWPIWPLAQFRPPA